MNLNQLHYFVKLADTEHYTKAAEELNISQPSLSHAISMLENELGTKLFEKRGRKYSPDQVWKLIQRVCGTVPEDPGYGSQESTLT